MNLVSRIYFQQNKLKVFHNKLTERLIFFVWLVNFMLRQVKGEYNECFDK